jgi:hypothetical protein
MKKARGAARRAALAAGLVASYALAHERPAIALRIDAEPDGRVLVSQVAGPRALVAFAPPARCRVAAPTSREGVIETARDLPVALRCAPGWAREPFVFSGLGAQAQAVTVRLEGVYTGVRTAYAAAPAIVVDDDAEPREDLLGPLLAGAEHVARGLDHLALVALLAASAGSIAALLVPLLGFTVAHALTLGFAAFGHPLFESRLAELLVAATLVLATEFRRDERVRARFAAAFAFGLVHGVAFLEGAAPLLARSERPARTLASFHVGIEAVQLAVALALAGLLRVAGRRAAGDEPVRRALTLAAGSYGVALFLARLA